MENIASFSKLRVKSHRWQCCATGLLYVICIGPKKNSFDSQVCSLILKWLKIRLGQWDLNLAGKWVQLHSFKDKGIKSLGKVYILMLLIVYRYHCPMAMIIIFAVTSLLFLLSTGLENRDILLTRNTYAQLGVSPEEIQPNKTNATSNSAGENNITTVTPIATAPGVNNTLIGRSTPTTTGNLSVENIKENNNTGEAEPIGGIK